MGLDYQSLELPAALRAWYKSGLRHVLYDFCSRISAQESKQRPDSKHEQIYFPEPWHSIWTNMQRCSATLLWTYYELGPDLQHQGTNQRTELFSRICTHLDLGREMIVFWPMAQQTAQGVQPRQDIFWQGVHLINPVYLLIFGQKAMQLLFPGLASCFGSYSQAGFQLIYLPGPEQMLPDNRQAKSYVWRMLLWLKQELNSI